jgi:Ca2+-binding EF-hand superfamily protein
MTAGPPRDDARWQPYDVNGDGKVTRAEFHAVRALCFVRYDQNGDGILTHAEIRRRLSGRKPEEFGAAIARLDRDGDGETTREEGEGESRRLFESSDTNGDGVIAGMELSALGTALQADLCQAFDRPQPNDTMRPRSAPRESRTPGGP